MTIELLKCFVILKEKLNILKFVFNIRSWMLLLRNVFVCLPYCFFGKPKIQNKTKKKKNTTSLAKK